MTMRAEDNSLRIRSPKELAREWEQERREWAKLKGTPHEHRIEQRLAVVYRRAAAHSQDFDVRDDRTPATALQERERERGEGMTMDELLQWDRDRTSAARAEILRELLAYFFGEGPHPGVVLRRVFAVAWALDRRGLLWNMTQTDVAMMFGETKAAMSWRIKKIFSGYLQKWGARGFKAPGQKSEEAVDAYAQAQRGNQNRRSGGRTSEGRGGNSNNNARNNGHGNDDNDRDERHGGGKLSRAAG